MEHGRVTRGKLRNRILSLFLTMCMVIGLLPSGAVPVKADGETPAAKYYVGNVDLDVNATSAEPQYDDNVDRNWKWDGKVLVFRKNVLYNTRGISLPAGSTIALLGGIKVQVSLADDKTPCVSCDGKLQIVGGGGLWLFNEANGGNAIECKGLKIGTTDGGDYKGQRPLVYCTCGVSVAGSNLEVEWVDGNYAIELITGQLTIGSGSSKIKITKSNNQEGKSIGVENTAVLYFPGGRNTSTESISENDVKCSWGVDGNVFYGSSDDYYAVYYRNKGYEAKYTKEEGYTLTTNALSVGDVATKENVRLCVTDVVNTYVTIASPEGYYFVGWCTSDGDSAIYRKEDELKSENRNKNDVLEMFPVFSKVVKLDEDDVVVDREKATLTFPNTHLKDSMYVVTYTVDNKDYTVRYANEVDKDGKKIRTATYITKDGEREKRILELEAGDDGGFVVNLEKIDDITDGECNPSDIDVIVAKEVQWIGSGYQEQVVSSEADLGNLNQKQLKPNAADFGVKQVEWKDDKLLPAQIGKKDGETLKGLTNEYEYQLPGSDEWISGEDLPSNISADIIGKDGIKVKVRRPATKLLWASETIEITLEGVREKMPDGKYDYLTSEVVDLKPNAKYEITIDGTPKTVETDSQGKVKVELGENTDHIDVKKLGGDDSNDSEKQTIPVNPRPAAPTAPNKYEKDGKTYIRVEKGYEYRIGKEGSNPDWTAWTPVEEEDGIELEVKDGEVIEIRLSATPTDRESLSVQVTKGQKIDIKIDYVAEKLTGFEADGTYEVKIGDGTPFTVTNKETIEIEESYLGKQAKIVKKGKNGEADSQPCEFTIPNRPGFELDYSGLVGFDDDDDVAWGEGDERLERKYQITVRGYQYRMSEEEEWSPSPNAEVLVSAGETLYIRNAAVANECFASKSASYQGAAKEFTPEVDEDDANDTGKLRGLVSGAKYAIGDDTLTADELGNISLDNYYGQQITIIKKGVTLNGTKTDDSEESASITLLIPVAEPDEDEIIQEVDETGQWTLIKNIPNKYEFSIENVKEGKWLCEIVDLKEGDTEDHTDWGTYIRVPVGTKVLLRRKAEEGRAPSKPILLMMQEAKPNASANYETEKLTGLVANAEYEIKVGEDGEPSKITADGSGEADLLDFYYGETLYIVKKGDGGNILDSAEQKLPIKAKPSVPSEVTDKIETDVDGGITTIKPIPLGYEYSLDDGKTWDPVPDTGEIKVPTGTVSSILIRKPATEEEPSSEPYKYVIPDPKPAEKTPEKTPTASANYTEGKLTGLVANEKYEITVDGTKKTVTADASGKTDLEPYYGKTISIVKLGNGTTTTNSAAQSLTINAKPPVTQPTPEPPKAPSKDQFETSINDDGYVVIKNVTSDMEYSLDGGKTWKPGTGKDIVVPVGTNVLIRIKATATTPASNPVEINTVTKVSTVTTVEKTITSANTDKDDVKGSTFSALQLKATGKSTSVKLTWKKVKGASGYIVYGSPCGEKMKKLKTIKGASKVTYTHKKLRAPKYYKYMVVAYKTVNGQKVTLATSKSAHATTTKKAVYGNPKKVKPKKTKVTIKKGKSTTLKTTYTLTKKKEKIHIAKFRYESSNTAVATVSKKGKVTGKKKGKATIYVYAQNGVYAKVTVTVK